MRSLTFLFQIKKNEENYQLAYNAVMRCVLEFKSNSELNMFPPHKIKQQIASLCFGREALKLWLQF